MDGPERRRWAEDGKAVAERAFREYAASISDQLERDPERKRRIQFELDMFDHLRQQRDKNEKGGS